ncbi:hypothetical protein ANCCEY_09068 [Ancylostoma ceylanicum]|nr:hypothetical protein ANCCEY_09068 [Ancylostoma ceylanicum]
MPLVLIDGKMLSNLRFADDIVLISKDTKEVNQLINELNEVGKGIGLEINMKKTQAIANQWSDNGTTRLDEILLQKVDSFVYLGREINMMNPDNRNRKTAKSSMGRYGHNSRESDQRHESTDSHI